MATTASTTFCSIETCQLKSTVLCYDCNKSYCPTHLKQHDQQLIEELRPLENIKVDLIKRIEKINVNKLIDEFVNRLDRWRSETHQAIDDFYKKTREELKEWPDKLNRPKSDLAHIETKRTELIQKGRTTHEKINHISQSFKFIQQNIKDIEEKGVQIDIPTISFDNSQNAIREYKLNDIDLINLSSPYRAISSSTEFGSAMMGNNENILIYDNRYLNLINRDLTRIEQLQWNDGIILDMSFYSKLNSFFILTDRRTIYQVRDNPLKTLRISTIPQEKWRCCTCSEEYLFLSTYGPDTFLVQYNVHPSFDRVQYWRTPSTCKSHESITNMKYTKETLALLIIDSIHRTVRLELRSSIDLKGIWSLSIDISRNHYQPTIRCCLYKHQQYLIITENSSNIHHISKYGTLISVYNYQPSVFNATLFTSNLLAIRTENKIFLHQL